MAPLLLLLIVALVRGQSGTADVVYGDNFYIANLHTQLFGKASYLAVNNDAATCSGNDQPEIEFGREVRSFAFTTSNSLWQINRVIPAPGGCVLYGDVITLKNVANDSYLESCGDNTFTCGGFDGLHAQTFHTAERLVDGINYDVAKWKISGAKDDGVCVAYGDNIQIINQFTPRKLYLDAYICGESDAYLINNYATASRDGLSGTWRFLSSTANACEGFPCSCDATCQDNADPAPYSPAGRTCTCNAGFDGDGVSCTALNAPPEPTPECNGVCQEVDGETWTRVYMCNDVTQGLTWSVPITKALAAGSTRVMITHPSGDHVISKPNSYPIQKLRVPWSVTWPYGPNLLVTPEVIANNWEGPAALLAHMPLSADLPCPNPTPQASPNTAFYWACGTSYGLHLLSGLNPNDPVFCKWDLSQPYAGVIEAYVNYVEINACLNNPCSCDAVCVDVKFGLDTPGGRTCECNPGFKGDGTFCEEITCDNSAADYCGPDAVCSNDAPPATLTCTCKPGFQGDGVTCTEVNCTNANPPCGPNTICTDVPPPATISCTCQDGYHLVGGTCTETTCANMASSGHGCSSNGLCTEAAPPAWVTCACKPGYQGDGFTCTETTCANQASSGQPCSVNAVCSEAAPPATVKCTCKSGYTGNGVTCTASNPPPSGSGTKQKLLIIITPLTQSTTPNKLVKLTAKVVYFFKPWQKVPASSLSSLKFKEGSTFLTCVTTSIKEGEVTCETKFATNGYHWVQATYIENSFAYVGYSTAALVKVGNGAPEGPKKDCGLKLTNHDGTKPLPVKWNKDSVTLKIKVFVKGNEGKLVKNGKIQWSLDGDTLETGNVGSDGQCTVTIPKNRFTSKGDKTVTCQYLPASGYKTKSIAIKLKVND